MRKIGVKVGDIMNRNFISISSKAKLKEAAQKMSKQDVGSLVVKDDGKLKGLLIEKDIVWALGKTSKALEEEVEKVAKKKVAKIRPSADVYEALEKMNKYKTRWLPVVDKDEIIGFLTLQDIVNVEPSLLEMAKSGIRNYGEQN